MGSELTKRLFVIAFIAALVVGIYYLASPYQNCVRAFKAEVGSVSLENKGVCLNRTSW
jgi:hypothetical protein